MVGRNKKARRENEKLIDEVGREEQPETGPHELSDLDTPREDLAVGRLDLGSVLIPTPEGAQLQVEMTQAGQPQAVHLVTPQGRITVAAYAAPKSPGQWREVAGELADSLRAEGAPVTVEAGPWGREVAASTPNGDIRFVGVDGYRWMIRAVASGPTGSSDAGSTLTAQARAIVEHTVVDRGTEPHPVRAALPIVLPPAMIEQLQAAAAAQQEQQARQQEQAQVRVEQAAADQSAAPVEDRSPIGDPEPPRRGPSGSAMQQLG